MKAQKREENKGNRTKEDRKKGKKSVIYLQVVRLDMREVGVTERQMQETE